MTDTLAIVLEGRTVGTLQMLRGGSLEVIYDDDYVADPGATPLSVGMPVVGQRWRGQVVRSWLANLLPDNDRVLERWAAVFNTTTQPFRLLQHVGRDVAGAVQFVKPDEVGGLDIGGVTWLDNDQLEARMAELRADPAAWTPQMAAGLFSLAGAQAKIALRYDDVADRWGLPYGSEPTTHILKPYGGDLPHQALNEHLSLSLAADMGLPTARSRILSIGGLPVISVERYDRFPTDEGVRRVHQEDCCQALKLPPARKYEVDNGPGVEDIVSLLRRVQGPADFSRDVNRFISALAFACGTAATDAHAKNYGLLLSGRQVALTPLYDLHSAAPYFTNDRRSVAPGQISVHRAGLAMRIGGARRFDEVDGDEWKTLAERAGLDEGRILDLATEMFEKLPDVARKLAAQMPVDRGWTEDETAFIDTYALAVERRAKNALACLRNRGPQNRRRRRPRERSGSSR